MNQFVKIPRKFLKEESNTKFLDTLVYAIIKAYECEGRASISYETISKKYAIPYKQVERAIARLKDAGYITVSKADSEKYEGYQYNIYEFPLDDTAFLMLKPELLSLDYNAKERGFLLHLQLCCIEGTNSLVESELNQLNVDKRTLNKYLKLFIKKEEIIKSRCLGLLNCKYLAKVDKPEINNLNTLIL